MPTSLTPRIVLAYIEHLPADSAFVAAIRGGAQFTGWTVSEYLLADLWDAIENNTYVTAAASSKRKPGKPKPYPRPRKKKQNAFIAMAERAKRAQGATTTKAVI